MGRIQNAAHEARKVINMTYQELVKKVQAAQPKADASKVEDHIAVQVNVTGEAEGAFYMEIAERLLYVEPYDYNDRNALLTADGADVLAMVQGKLSLDAAVAEGKVAVEGDYDKLATLLATFPVKKTAAKKADATEEAPAKKAPAKKTAAKKTTKAADAKAEAPAKKTTAKKAAPKAAEAKEETAEKPKRGRKTATKKTDK